MSSTVTNTLRARSDRFEPEVEPDPAEQRKLRGHLDQIDYVAYAANRAVVGQALASVELRAFERVAIATAHARANWITTVVKMTETGAALSAEQITQVAALRIAFDEMTEAYDAMRRLVERGYMHYQPKP
ncbi:MAG: hypothetical protein IPG56_11365 [Caulobacteraceae bacterium]|nr:hypothetical protein [Caulobacteraceae bacterium]